MKNKRKFVRIPENAQIFYKIIPGDKVVECTTEDISEGGIKFIAQELIPHGSHLRIRINFNKTLFSFEALVRRVWVKEVPHGETYEIGVEFIDMPKDAAKYLKRYVEALSETKE